MKLPAEPQAYVLWLDVDGVGFVKASEGLRSVPLEFPTFAECWMQGIELLSRYGDILGFSCLVVEGASL